MRSIQTTIAPNKRVLLGWTAMIILGVVFTGTLLFTSTATADDVSIHQLPGDGSEENPFVITNVYELQAMSQNLTNHYSLADDIDASGTTTWEGGAGFDPIGDRDNRDPFVGSFDGNGYTIENLHIDRPADTGVGLFGYSAGSVENIHLEDVDVSGEDRVGSVVGENTVEDETGGVIRDVSVSGEVYGTDRRIGGVVGVNEGTVSEVSMNGDVGAVDRRVGGVVGINEGPMDESYFVGTVEGGRFGGGLVGINEGPVRASFAAGEVTGERTLGGVAAENTDALNNVYSVANISGERSVGGLAAEHTGTVSGVYVTGPVISDQDSAGLIDSNSGIVNDAYWNTETTGHSEPFSDDVDEFDEREVDVSGLTSNELTGQDGSENTNLDIDSPWVTTNDYPRFQWEDDRNIPDEAYNVTLEPVDVEEEDDDDDEPDPEELPDDDDDEPLAMPGFGVATAIVALVAAIAFVGRRV